MDVDTNTIRDTEEQQYNTLHLSTFDNHHEQQQQQHAFNDGITLASNNTTTLLSTTEGEKEEERRYGSDRVGSKFISKFERAKVIGVRALQLSLGAETYLTIDPEKMGELEPLEMATEEYQKRLLPWVIVRRFEDGSVEHWRLQELRLI